MTERTDEETGSYVSSSDEDDEQLLNVAGGAGREEEWEEWQGEAADADEDVTKSLFGPERLPNPEAAMDHDAAKFGFDIRQFAIQERLDEYGIIRVINFIRSQVAAGSDPLPLLAAASGGGAAGAAAPWLDDRYLVPALEDDALLFYDFEDVAAAAAAAAAGGTPDGAAGPGAAGGGGDGAAAAATATAASELARLREENEALRTALAAMRQAFLPEELREDSGGEGPSTSAAAAAPAPAAADAGAGASTSVPAAGSPGQAADPEAAAAAAVAAAAARKVDAAYFDSYSYFDIHREMLGDKPRTESYQAALERNPGLIRGATVLDVGCGTGILSLFACRGGAARVVAVDGSERIAGFARRHAELAGYSDSTGGPMTVVSGKLEELAGKLPVKQVDVIVSEWMGYALLFETMLDTVLHARDVYLRPGGAVLPDRASIFIAGASSAAGGLGFWKDVYGFDMSPVAGAIAEAGQGQAVVLEVRPEHLITDTACVKELDLCTMRSEDQDFTAEFRLQALPPPTPQPTNPDAQPAQQPQQPQGGSGPREVGCIALWFETAFSQRHCSEHPVVLSTSPYQPTTHWVQTLLTLRKPVPLAGAVVSEPGAAGGCAGASVISGRISVVRSRQQHRSLDIALEYRAELSDGNVIEEAQLYHMSVTAPS
ncbi:hypothetical protein PLESTB_000030300 [Pleodorina starrii]|uniref:type I protein arginine methyltransferase n=1 Tax=Pleodorina starrii TaxID=330485 RepID=A0A9W6B9P0_9CHLO|nr:hypothetical protein PLESTM_001104200 [Pleodorina starrii]GLC47830.1 hypothetical protein PLESTB_000030300 [Pleodorina starrii]